MSEGIKGLTEWVVKTLEGMKEGAPLFYPYPEDGKVPYPDEDRPTGGITKNPIMTELQPGERIFKIGDLDLTEERTTMSETFSVDQSEDEIPANPYMPPEFLEHLENGRDLLKALRETNDIAAEIQQETERAKELGTWPDEEQDPDDEWTVGTVTEGDEIPEFSNPFDSELNVKVSSAFICDNERAEVEVPWVVTLENVRYLLRFVISTAPEFHDRTISIALRGIAEDGSEESFLIPLAAVDCGVTLQEELEAQDEDELNG